MPIYEYACGRCRKIYSFFSKRVSPDTAPTCPKCGSNELRKEISSFALISGGQREDASPNEADGPNLDDPRVDRALREIERDMDHIDENNPRHMAALMRRMKDILPSEEMPKELDAAIRRMEKGEDLDKIEADMGDEIEAALNDAESGLAGDDSGSGAAFERDPDLYDF